MDKNEFWKVIDLIDKDALEDCDEEVAVEPLIEFLASKSEDYIGEFQECLSKALYDIDGQKWMDQSGDSRDSGDGFLYARCYVVAKGKNYYTKVLSNPTEMPKSCDQWAESLIYVAGQAWAEITGNDEADYERESSVNFESFSNKEFW